VDRQGYVERRAGRCMAKILEEFERNVERRLPPEVAQEFKVTVRRRVGAFRADVEELLDLQEKAEELNGAAIEIRDKVYPDGRRPRRQERVTT
jgi:hypothetical protein